MGKIKAMCPECGLDKLLYDDWEDMYSCPKCYLFWYPEEVGEKTNKNAPIFNIGVKNGGE